MDAETVEQSYNTTTNQVRTNTAGYASAQALQIRLDPTQLIENLEMFLKGAKVIVQRDSDGKMTQKMVDSGKPLANDIGVHSILNLVSTVINPHVVQGNFPIDGPKQSSLFETYVTQFHENLATDLMNNIHNWGVQEDDYNSIINMIMNLVVPFMTRLVDNKERQSYGESLVYSATDRQSGKSGGLGIFQRNK